MVRVKASFHVDNLGIKVPISESEDQWVPFLYENIPLIFFIYGKLGHHLKDYKEAGGVINATTNET